jgi:hypothetical protein
MVLAILCYMGWSSKHRYLLFTDARTKLTNSIFEKGKVVGMRGNVVDASDHWCLDGDFV